MGGSKSMTVNDSLGAGMGPIVPRTNPNQFQRYNTPESHIVCSLDGENYDQFVNHEILGILCSDVVAQPQQATVCFVGR